jgi:hypothetical protein
MPSSELFELVTSSEYEGEYVKYEDYDKLVRHLNDIIPPMPLDIRIGGVNVFHQTLGYPPARVKNLLNKYFGENDISIKAESNEIDPLIGRKIEREEMLEQIIWQIESDIPVPLMAGIGGEREMTEIDIATREVIIVNGKPVKEKFKVHWVNIVGIIKDEIAGTTVFETTCWGRNFLVDFDEFYDNTQHLDGVILIEKE